MDINALYSALLSLTELTEQIRSARATVSAANVAAGTAPKEYLDAMERELQIAKSTLARELGFPVSHDRRPELPATDSGDHEYCPALPGNAPAIDIPGHKRSGGATNRGRMTKASRLDAFTRSQKDKLLGLRDKVVDSIAGVARGTLRPRVDGTEAPTFVGDQADAGNDASDRDFALSLLSQEHDALTEIDQALKRIESGAYGICEISSKPIPRARLQAIPFARYTVECQAQIEKQRKATKTRQSAASLLDLEEKDGQEEENLPETKREPTLAQRIVTLDYVGV